MLNSLPSALHLQVNNAAVSFNEIDTNSVEHAETVLRTNFYGAKMLIEALLPLFRRSAANSRILNISSQLGLLNVSDHQFNGSWHSNSKRITSAI